MSTDRELDSLLAATREREWPGSARNTRIEEFIMHEATRQNGSSRARRAGLLFGIGGLMLAGAVYGATRLYEQYRVRLTVNGVQSEHTVEAGPDGTALMEVQLPGGGHARVLVGPENVGGDGQIHVGLTVEGGPGEASATVTADDAGDADKGRVPEKAPAAGAGGGK